MDGLVEVLEAALDTCKREGAPQRKGKEATKDETAKSTGQDTHESAPLDSVVFKRTLDAAAGAAGHDLRKLFVLTSKRPVKMEDVCIVCEECQRSSLMLVKHCLTALHSHGEALHAAVLTAIESYLSTSRAWVAALIKNNNVASSATTQLMGRVEESIKTLTACPTSAGEAVKRKLEAQAALISDGLEELAEEVRENDELLEQDPSLAEQGASSSKKVHMDDDNDDDHDDDDEKDDFGQTLWIGKQRDLVYPAVAFIKAAMKLLQKTASLAPTLEEGQLVPLEPHLLTGAGRLSPLVDDVILALYEPEDMHQIHTSCKALHDAAWETLHVVILISSVREGGDDDIRDAAQRTAAQDDIIRRTEESRLKWVSLLGRVLTHNREKLADVIRETSPPQ